MPCLVSRGLNSVADGTRNPDLADDRGGHGDRARDRSAGSAAAPADPVLSGAGHDWTTGLLSLQTMLWIGSIVAFLGLGPKLIAILERIARKRRLEVKEGGPIAAEREAAGGL